MIDPIKKKPSWKRRLNTELGLRQQDRVRESIGADITAFSYKTGMSLGTETRVQLQCAGEPFIEIYEDDKGFINVEVQGLESYGVYVRVSPLKDQTVESDGNHHEIR